MSNITNFSILLLGEAAVDLISSEAVKNLKDAKSYEKFAGGQVANLAMNLSRLGFKAYLGVCIGQDSFGIFLHEQLTEAGVDLKTCQTTTEAPTTVIPIVRNTGAGTPDFMVYRGADRFLKKTDDLLEALDLCQSIHTSAFALSQDPCRSTVLSLLDKAHKSEKLISLDPNYHPGLCPDLPDFVTFLKDIFKLVNVTKPSLDDSIRIFGPGLKPEDYIDLFIELGPKLVVLTMGNQGALVGTSSGDRYRIQASAIPVIDITGAGDAFWSGLLSGFLSGMSALEAAKLGQALAEYKIGILGPIKHALSFEEFKISAQKITNVPFSSK